MGSAKGNFLDDADRSGFELQSFMLWRNGAVVAINNSLLPPNSPNPTPPNE